MTELATQELARARAARIRAGIQNYLHTLADIAAAYAQRDWTALGYADWQSYVDGEYSEHRLRLTPEHRAKAVAELRLAGMSQRAIGSALGVSQDTVRRDLTEVNDSVHVGEIQGADGKTYAASRPQTPAPMPEPEPAVDVAGSGHNHPRPAERPAAQPQAYGRLPQPGAGDPLPAGIAEQIRQRIAEKVRADSDLDDLDDPDAIAAQQRQLSSENVAKGLVALHFALDADPLRWLAQTWQPDAYRERDLPRVRDAFTASGLRSIAKNLDTIADHLDRTGGSL